MAIDLAILAADRLAVISDIPIDVIYNGEDPVSCRKSVLKADDKSASPGLISEYVFSIHSVTAAWTTLPALGGLLTIAGTEYRILKVVTDPVGTRFDMGAKYTDR